MSPTTHFHLTKIEPCATDDFTWIYNSTLYKATKLFFFQIKRKCRNISTSVIPDVWSLIIEECRPTLFLLVSYYKCITTTTLTDNNLNKGAKNLKNTGWGNIERARLRKPIPALSPRWNSHWQIKWNSPLPTFFCKMHFC